MSYVISGTHTSGVVLSNSTTQNPATVASGGYVTNPTAVGDREAIYGTNAAAWTLSNYGTISAAGASIEGVVLANGGDITNAATGFIYGYDRGIAIYAASGTVTNSGTIANGNTAAFEAIHLFAGGYVGNTATTALIAGQAGGVYIGGGAGSVVNFGTIVATAAGANGNGVYLHAGGLVTNSGLIKGNLHGVLIAGGVGTVVNSGSISTTVGLHAGGTVDNTGTGVISAHYFAVSVGGGAGAVDNSATITASGSTGIGVDLAGSTNASVTNSGTVTANGTAGVAVLLNDGGQVTNKPSATISGYKFGVEVNTAAGTIVNAGTIAAGSGTSSSAVDLLAGGSITNQTGGTIGGSAGITIKGGSGAVVNSGTIVSTGVSFGNFGIYLAAGGSVINSAGGFIAAYRVGVLLKAVAATVVNSGTIQSTSTDLDGVYAAAGLVVNQLGALILGAGGVSVGFPGSGQTYAGIGTIINLGTIAATGSIGVGVDLGVGGVVNNAAGQLIAGAGKGVDITAGTGTVVNLGTVEGTSPTAFQVEGVLLQSGGAVVNGSGTLAAATIAGVQYGLLIGGAAGSVVNYGTIAATGTGGIGVRLVAGGTIGNKGEIEGLGTGIFIDSNATVTNGQSGSATGVITGITGMVVGQSGTGGPSTVVNYGTIAGAQGGSGIAMVLAGSLANYGTIVDTGSSSDAVDLEAGGAIDNGGSGATAALISAGSNAYAVSIGGSAVATNYGTIVAGHVGVIASGAPGTLFNHGLIDSTPGSAVYFVSGGYVSNASGGRLIGYNGGIGIARAAGTVINSGTIAGTGTSATAVSLYGGLLSNAFGALIAGAGGVAIAGSAGGIANFGTIAGSTPGFGGLAINLGDGGTLANSGLIAATGALGVFTANAPATVTNSGTIVSSPGGGFFYVGVFLSDGGYLTNRPGGLVEGYPGAVAILGAPATLTNLGTITATDTGSNGVYFGTGGVVSNGPGARLAGYAYGVKIAGSSGTVVNLGAMAGTGAGADAIDLINGGVVQNSGLLAGSGDVVEIDQGGLLSNLGTILGAAASYGVCLREGGTLTNGATGLPAAMISVYGNAVEIQTNPGTVANYGMLASTGTNGAAVVLHAGGTLANTGTIAGVAAGLKSYAAANVTNVGSIFGITGIYDGGAGAIVNSGGITGTGGAGVYLRGGSFTNQSGGTIVGYGAGVDIGQTSGAVVNLGTIESTWSSGAGVALEAGGTVTNRGVINALGTAYPTGVYLASGGLVDNFGLIDGRNDVAINAAQGGTVVNEASAVLQASDAVILDGTAAGIANYGTILGTTEGIGLKATGGTVLNAGVISGTGLDGVYLYGGGTATNTSTGLIDGYRGIIGTHNPGTVDNLGTIVGTGSNGIGVDLMVPGSVLANAGTIVGEGGIAVVLAGIGDRLIVDPGAVFAGVVYDGGTAGTLELAAGAGTGALSGLGANFTGFGALVFDSGAAWQVGGAATAFSAVAISGFQAADTLDLGGIVANGGTYVGGVLTLTNNGVVATTLTLSTPITNPAFTVGTDGSGGTVVKVSSASTGMIFSGTYTSGIVLSNPTTQNPATVASGGYVTNNTATYSGDAVFGTGAAAWSFANYGTIAATQTGVHGILFQNGGTVTNAAGGLINSAFNAVEIDGTRGAVYNFGTIRGSYPTGNGAHSAAVDLRKGGVVINGAPTATSALIVGSTYSQGIYFGNFRANYGPSAAGTVLNYGTIAVNRYDAIVMSQGGTVINSGKILSSDGAAIDIRYGLVTNIGLIQGYFGGVASTFGPGLGGPVTAVNQGTIAGPGTASAGVSLLVGGLVTNASTGTITGGADGVQISGGAGTIANYGMVESSNGDGVDLQVGGVVTNAAGALIAGANEGVAITGPTGGTVINGGTIASSNTNNAAVELYGGGGIGNTGLIAGVGTGIFVGGLAGTIANSGTIIITGSRGNAIRLYRGGILDNSGLIQGGGGGEPAVGIYASPGTIDNSGTIAGINNADAIVVGAGGYVGNALTGAIAGYDGIRISGPSATLVNFGTVDATGTGFGAQAIDLLSGGTAVNYGAVFGVGTDASGINAGFAADLITNQAGGLIAGWLNGIDQFSGAGTVVNYGTIESSNGDGVDLQAGGVVTNGASGVITGTVDAIAVAGGAGTVVNLGSLGGGGIYLTAGGSVSNASSGVIDGAIQGIAVGNGVGTVVNAGAINGTGTNSGGVYLTAGGSVTNSLTGIIEGTSDGIAIGDHTGTAGASGLVLNLGTAGASGANGDGIELLDGSVINGAPGDRGAAITGSLDGVFVGNSGATIGGPGTVINYGSISGGNTGVWLEDGGTAVNFNLIAGTGTGGDGLVTGTTASGLGTVANYGTIAGPNLGVWLAAGGALRNYGVIAGNFGIGVNTGSGTVINYGTVIGAAFNGIYMQAGGSVVGEGTILSTGSNSAVFINRLAGAVTNYGTIVAAGADGIHLITGIVTNSGMIVGPSGVGIAQQNGTGPVGIGTVVNRGTIESTGSTSGVGVYFQVGGTLTNAGGLLTAYRTGVSFEGSAGTIVNTGTIAHVGTGTSGQAVYFGAGGLLTNYGLIIGARAGTSSANGYPGAVDAHNQVVTVVNLGTIANPNDSNGVNLLAGGLLINGSPALTTALISALHGAVYMGGTLGVPTPGAVGTVINYGIIQNTGNSASAISLVSGGLAANRGVVASGRTGIAFSDTAGTIVNYGSISSSAPLSATGGAGVYLGNGGLITNAAGGSIEAVRPAISLARNGTATADATVVNSGFLLGNYGVAIGTSGATGINTIINYGTIVGTSGIAIRLGAVGDEVVLEPGSQLSGAIGNFHQGDTIDLPGVSANGISYAGGVVTLTNGATVVAELDVLTPLVNPQFTEVPDGAGGSEITVTAAIVVSAGVTFVVSAGETLSNIIVLSGGVLDVDAGATVIDVQVEAGGVETVAAGGLDISATVASGGFQDLFGTASDTLIVAGGSQTVEPGGVADNTVLDSAAVQTVSGTASGTVVSSGDTQIVASGGVASDTTVSSGGTQIVASGGSASGSIVYSGGTEIVSAGGVDVGAVLSGGLEEVFGSASGIVIDNGGVQTVEAGGSDSDTVTLAGGGYLDDGAGGSITAAGDAVFGTTGANTIVNNGTILSTAGVGIDLQAGGGITNGASGIIQGLAGGAYVFGGVGTVTNFGTIAAQSSYSDGVYLGAGGLVSNAGLINGAFDGVDVRISGTVTNSGTIVGHGSGNVAAVFLGFTYSMPAFLVENTGTITSTAPGVLLRGAGIVVNGDSGSTGAVIQGGGYGGVDIFGGASTVVNFGTIAGTDASSVGVGLHGNGSTLVNAGTIIGSIDFGGDSLVDLQAGAVVAGAVTFAGAGSTLEIDGTTMPTSTIDGFVQGETLDLRGVVASSATLEANNVLAVSAGGLTFTLQLDPAQNFGTDGFSVSADGSGGTDVTLSVAPPQLFQFIFTYADGKDYYLGTVVDNGSFGYFVGETISFGLGQYQIFNDLGPTSQPAGTVFVTDYSHDGPGLASSTPVAFAAGLPDGAHGLGSESDAVLETDGTTQAFGPTVEVPFPTTALFGFVYTYANGAFYTGTVADDGRFGVAAGSRTITDGAGNFVGSYTIFADGTTALAAGTVVIDRVTVDGQAFLPNQTIAGSGGLGSEAGSITVNGQTVAFSDQVAPAVLVTIKTAPPTPPPPPNTVFEADVNQIFADVLGRNPTSSELTTYTAMLSASTDTTATETAIRQTLAQSSEGQSDLNQLFVQIFNQPIDPTDDATYTTQIIDGSSLAAVQLQLAQSQQAQADLGQIFQQVLNRPIDGLSLITYMGALADGGSLATVRQTLAFAPEAQNDLNLLFVAATGRDPSAAELVGMEDQLANGATQAALQTALTNTGSAGGYTVAPVPAGSAGLTAAPGTPTMFVFDGANFGNDTIAGFDPSRDTIQLPQTFAANFTGLQTDMSAAAGGTLINLAAGQSILIEGVAPGSLSAANFLLGPPPAAVPITAPPAGRPPDDLAGTGTSDILWRNSDGSLALWTMNGSVITAGQALTYQGNVASPASSWSVAGTGDFNGDGMADILWRDASGALATWTMVGSQIAAESTVVALDASWSVAGIGDFDGDRMADVLWRDTSGNVAIWEMNGASVAASALVGYADPTTWAIRGIGDFNGDGKSDILWQDTSGNVDIWEMEGTSVVAGGLVGYADPATWHIDGIGDFNGDGKSDILWQDTSGDVAIWEMNGLGVAASAIVGFVDPSSWQVAGIGDYDGDGKSDILWRSTSGALSLWTMNGSVITASQAPTYQGNPVAPDSTWRPLG